MTNASTVKSGTKVFCIDIDDPHAGEIGVVNNDPAKYGNIEVTWRSGEVSKVDRRGVMPAEFVISVAAKLSELDRKLHDPTNALDGLETTDLLGLVLGRAQALEHRLEEDPEAKAVLLRRRLSDVLGRLGQAITAGADAPDVAEAVSEWENTFVIPDEAEEEIE